MILAIDSSSAACTAALIGPGGDLVGERHEDIGRGHAERLMPMIADLVEGHVPTRILVGVGPGSFTGLRVALAAAHGMAIGWAIPLCGVDSLALAAAGAEARGPVGVAMIGGHGEWFVAQYDAALGVTLSARSLTPDAAAAMVDAYVIVGSAAQALVDLRGSGTAAALVPRAALVMRLPLTLRSLDPRPVYARAPDAKPLVMA